MSNLKEEDEPSVEVLKTSHRFLSYYFKPKLEINVREVLQLEAQYVRSPFFFLKIVEDLMR